MPVAAESCGRCFCIDQSMRGHRAVVAPYTNIVLTMPEFTSHFFVYTY